MSLSEQLNKIHKIDTLLNGDNSLNKPNDKDIVKINYYIYISNKNKDINNINLNNIKNESLVDFRTNIQIKLSDSYLNNYFIYCIKQLYLNETALFEIDSKDIDEFVLNNIFEKYNKDSKAFSSNFKIYYLVELLQFEEYIKSKYEMSLDEKIEFAKNKKTEGVNLFKLKKFDDASNCFDIAAGYLLSSEYTILNNSINDKYLNNAKELLTSLLLNLSNCYNNLKKYELCEIKCSFIINVLKNYNPKAYYYRAIAYTNIACDNSSLKKAEEDLKILEDSISKEDEGIIYLKELILDKKKIIEQSQRTLYKNFFKNSKAYNDKEMPLHKSIPKEINPYNPKVYIEIEVGTYINANDKSTNPFESKTQVLSKEYEETKYIKVKQRLEFELFADVVPKTTENFLLLITTGKYNDTIFHRLIKDSIIQGGDYENYNGTGGKSIYGKSFEDENFVYKHTEAGLLSMANSGPNTNGSQFFITLNQCSNLDNKHVVFGKIIKGIEFLDYLNMIETGDNNRPIRVIKIAECGKITK